MFAPLRSGARPWAPRLAFAAVLGAFLTAGAPPVLADSTVNTGYFGGVAIMGYDPVAYFTENRAMKGSEDYSYEWLGTPWHFANARHRDMFISDPVAYAPQYGGYCAGEVIGGSVTVDIDPEAFRIIDGKLYLIYDQVDADDFAAHAAEYIPRADANWPGIRGELEMDQFR